MIWLLPAFLVLSSYILFVPWTPTTLRFFASNSFLSNDSVFVIPAYNAFLPYSAKTLFLMQAFFTLAKILRGRWHIPLQHLGGWSKRTFASLRTAWATQRIQGQPKLFSETLFPIPCKKMIIKQLRIILKDHLTFSIALKTILFVHRSLIFFPKFQNKFHGKGRCLVLCSLPPQRKWLAHSSHNKQALTAQVSYN